MIGPSGTFQSPGQEASKPRYSVKKMEGSQWAWIVDNWKGGYPIKKYNVLKGDGWARADKHCAELNAEANAGR